VFARPERSPAKPNERSEGYRALRLLGGLRRGGGEPNIEYGALAKIQSRPGHFFHHVPGELGKTGASLDLPRCDLLAEI
jgi:hypothetical protein